MRTFLRMLNLFVLIASLAWLVVDPGWEPLVTFLALLAIFLAQVFLPTDTSEIEADRKLFERLHELLPSQHIRDISDYNFGAAFRVKWIEPLILYDESWIGPEHEFHDKKLEKRKQKLSKSVNDFVKAVAYHTYREKSSIQRLPREMQRDNPKEYWKLAGKINELSSQVGKDHQDLIRSAKKRLKI